MVLLDFLFGPARICIQSEVTYKKKEKKKEKRSRLKYYPAKTRPSLLKCAALLNIIRIELARLFFFFPRLVYHRMRCKVSSDCSTPPSPPLHPTPPPQPTPYQAKRLLSNSSKSGFVESCQDVCAQRVRNCCRELNPGVSRFLKLGESTGSIRGIFSTFLSKLLLRLFCLLLFIFLTASAVFFSFFFFFF